MLRQKVLALILLPLLLMSIAVSSFSIFSINKYLEELSLTELIRESEHLATELERVLEKYRTVIDTFAIAAGYLFDQGRYAGEGDSYLNEFRDAIAPIVHQIARDVNNSKGTFFMFAPDYGSVPSQVWYYESVGRFSRIFEYPDAEQFDRDNPNMLYYYYPLDKRESFWSPPYRDFDTGDLMLSYTAPVVQGRRAIGIAGIDLTIDFISQMISEIRFRDEGYAFLINSSYEFIYHPLFPFGTLLEDATGPELAFLVDIMKSSKDKDTVLYDFRGEKKRLGFKKLSNGWTVSVTAFESELFQPAREARLNLILINLAIQLIVLVVGYITARFISRPVDLLTAEVKQSIYDMESTLANPLLLNRKDEIGNLSRQFRKLQMAFQKTIQTLIANNISQDRLAQLGDKVGAFTHELKTPIGVVITSVSFTEERLRELERKLEEGISRRKMDELLKDIKEGNSLAMRNLNQANGIITDFKSLAVSQSALTKESVNLKETIDQAIQSASMGIKGKKITFENRTPETMTIHSCKGYLTQVFTNLFHNSINHGFLNRDRGLIRIESIKLSDSILIKYSDNGIGIADDIAGKIFEPYFTSAKERGGSGLGLHIVRTIIQEHLNGTIEHERSRNPGALFHIRLSQTQSD